MKIIAYIACVILLAGCSGKARTTAVDSVVSVKPTAHEKTDSKASAFKPYHLIDGFMVTDTGYVDAVVMGGSYSIITRNGALVDTIEKGFSVQKIADNTYFYQTVTSDGPLQSYQSKKTGYKTTINGSFADYKILTNGKKQTFSAIAPDFNDYFSSPYIINGKVYYWQIKQIDSTGNSKISAAEFDPVTKTTNSHFVQNDFIETDDSSYFPYPYLQKDTIYFDNGRNKVMKFSKDFKLFN